MQERRIQYLESAIVDLENLSSWLLEVASERVADRYIDRIRERIATLRFGGERGTIRDDTDGVRLIGILKSITVAFVVEPESVKIVRILYRGQDRKALANDDDDAD